MLITIEEQEEEEADRYPNQKERTKTSAKNRAGHQKPTQTPSMANKPAPHLLVIPFPAQGHVIPLMKLSVRLAAQFGFRITFVNLQSSSGDGDDEPTAGGLIRMVGIGDGGNKSTEAVQRLMPGRVEELIDRMMMNSSGSDVITCVLADQTNGWALEIAGRRGIRRVGFCPAAAATVAVQFSIPMLIRDGIIDEEGSPTEETQPVKLSDEMPAMNPSEFVWNCFADKNVRKHIFEMAVGTTESMRSADWLLCNSSPDIEPGSFLSPPNLLPIGPLLRSPEPLSTDDDQACLTWLNHHPPNSVIYVAFGTTARLDKSQLRELALGLELTNRPFYWVVRSDEVVTAEIDSVLNRAKQGRVVSRAPQEKVLEHPSVGCFISHCGWNSTLEGLSNGVPFVCWPYFADQFMNARYVCEVWRVGVRMVGSGGVVGREEVREKVERVVGSVEMKERSLEMMAMAKGSVGEGGRSNEGLVRFAEWVRGL